MVSGPWPGELLQDVDDAGPGTNVAARCWEADQPAWPTRLFRRSRIPLPSSSRGRHEQRSCHYSRRQDPDDPVGAHRPPLAPQPRAGLISRRPLTWPGRSCPGSRSDPRQRAWPGPGGLGRDHRASRWTISWSFRWDAVPARGTRGHLENALVRRPSARRTLHIKDLAVRSRCSADGHHVYPVHVLRRMLIPDSMPRPSDSTWAARRPWWSMSTRATIHTRPGPRKVKRSSRMAITLG